MAQEERGLRSLKALIGEVIRPGDGTGEPVVIADGAVPRLKAELDRHLDTEALFDGVETLLVASMAVQTQYESPTAARTLREIAESKNVVASMRSMNDAVMGDVQEALAQSASDFSNVVGRELARRAPRLGEKAPKGTIKIDFFNLPKRA